MLNSKPPPPPTCLRRLLLPALIAARLVGVESGGETGLAEFVVKLFFLFVAQHIVGDGKLFKLVLGVFITRVDVRMEFPRKLAVRFADIVL